MESPYSLLIFHYNWNHTWLWIFQKLRFIITNLILSLTFFIVTLSAFCLLKLCINFIILSVLSSFVKLIWRQKDVMIAKTKFMIRRKREVWCARFLSVLNIENHHIKHKWGKLVAGWYCHFEPDLDVFCILCKFLQEMLPIRFYRVFKYLGLFT